MRIFSHLQDNTHLRPHPEKGTEGLAAKNTPGAVDMMH